MQVALYFRTRALYLWAAFLALRACRGPLRTWVASRDGRGRRVIRRRGGMCIKGHILEDAPAVS